MAFVNPPESAHDVRGKDVDLPPDPMVRDWYQATTMWMQRHEQRDIQHLQEALRLFPTMGCCSFSAAVNMKPMRLQPFKSR